MAFDAGHSPGRRPDQPGRASERDVDGPGPFADLEAALPSEEVRTRVLAAATARAVAIRRARQRKSWALAGLAAGTLIALGLSAWLPRSDGPSRDGPSREGQRVEDTVDRSGESAGPVRSPVSVPATLPGLAHQESDATSTTHGERAGAVYRALDDIRADLAEIYERAGSIDPQRAREQQVIYGRIGECLTKLEELNRRVAPKQGAPRD